MNIDREKRKFSENIYKILQIKLPLFHVFCGGHGINFHKFPQSSIMFIKEHFWYLIFNGFKNVYFSFTKLHEDAKFLHPFLGRDENSLKWEGMPKGGIVKKGGRNKYKQYLHFSNFEKIILHLLYYMYTKMHPVM